MEVTPGLPLNWSWMHKPSVFLAVCQCERGGGSCRSGPGLNDGAHNLCFARQWLCELWLVLLMLPCAGIRQVSVVGPPVNPKLPEIQTQSSERNEGTDRMDVERVKEKGKCTAGDCIVLVNEDLGHCVPANLYLSGWGCHEPEPGMRARRPGERGESSQRRYCRRMREWKKRGWSYTQSKHRLVVTSAFFHPHYILGSWI